MPSNEKETIDINLKNSIQKVISSGYDPIKHLEKLNYPRRAGSPGDKKAVEYISSTLQNLGYNPEIQEFKYLASSKPTSLRFPLVIFSWGVLTILNILYLENNPIISLITLILPTVILIGIFNFEFFVKFFFKRRRKQSEELELNIKQEKLTEHELKRINTSQNVIAEIGDHNATHHFLFTAHLDSISSKLPMRFTKIAGIFGFGSFCLFSLGYTLNFLLVIIFDSYFMNSWTLFYLILVLTCLILLETIIFLRSFRGNESHGIIDDGSGVAILLELAKYLKSQKLINHKFTLGFFGAEEAGLIGSSYYHRHSSLPHNTHIISVDMIGEKAPLKFVKGINPLIKTKLNSTFNNKLISIANQLEIELKESSFPYPGSDFAHWLYDGYQTNWLINSSRFIHSKNDHFENVDETLVTDALRLLLAYIYLELSNGSNTNI